MSSLEILRKQYWMAYGVETSNSYGFVSLLVMLFVSAYVTYET